VASGRYKSASEALREGALVLQERERERAALDAAIARGLADVETGRLTPASEVFERLDAKYRAMLESKPQ
jgi:antitoxin ParD1/3/4